LEELPMTRLMLTCVASLSLTAVAATWQAPVELKEGDTAPAFSLPGSDGKVHKLSDLKGRAVVLAWFPKAFTGG